ncbi:MAG: hypothetical protein KME49_17585 [Brasilonema octagenarum HA4186-MV1]|uniref:Uncharacterized protein n=2 Tax=Brasilonema TaxID=383614 RepID=A0A856M829_9CYAN|nr:MULTISPECIES: hypothetical protein [Brasilonema]MBW4627262.1 hypothetical protein [Brasilonema octagenarum HA4186-MV1]NMF62120.1 hypothetical protein [Brasilonema octagenarum UFV-OR1]QDL06544.1 hypothetical protein DP114_00240 [Brasilonema sennae CENA114]QDL12915.1 hypothetical protein DP113_00240 [Brasilonema octagenarum UFV-E1]
MKKLALLYLVTFLSFVVCLSINAAQPRPVPPLWQVYQQSFQTAKYVDLTHSVGDQQLNVRVR